MNLRFSIILTICSILLSCRKENRFDCFKGNGKEVTEIRSPGEFNEIEVVDKMEVTIIYGKEHKIEITAGEHIIKNISTTINNGVLKLENLNTCNFVRGYKKRIHIKVSLPYIKKLANNGVGPVTFEDFNQDTLFVRAENSGDIYVNGNFSQVRTSSHGNGDIYLNGTTNSLMIYSYGTNFTQASKMLVKNYIYISTYSFGDAKLNLSPGASLDYLIWSKGNIYYSGNPVAIHNLSEVEAGGSLIKED